MSDEAPETPADDTDRPALGEPAPDDHDALLSRLRVIEDQPLDARAAALAQLHDELRAALEAGDLPG